MVNARYVAIFIFDGLWEEFQGSGRIAHADYYFTPLASLVTRHSPLRLDFFPLCHSRLFQQHPRDSVISSAQGKHTLNQASLHHPSSFLRVSLRQ